MFAHAASIWSRQFRHEPASARKLSRPHACCQQCTATRAQQQGTRSVRCLGQCCRLQAIGRCEPPHAGLTRMLPFAPTLVTHLLPPSPSCKSGLLPPSSTRPSSGRSPTWSMWHSPQSRGCTRCWPHRRTCWPRSRHRHRSAPGRRSRTGSPPLCRSLARIAGCLCSDRSPAGTTAGVCCCMGAAGVVEQCSNEVKQGCAAA